MPPLWDWLKDNHGAVSALTSLLMVGIWAAYLHLFLNQYRRHRRPMILINRGGGASLDARCLVANRSEAPIYLEAVVVRLDGTKGSHIRPLSFLGSKGEATRDSRRNWYQGPLACSELIELGTYRDLAELAKGDGRGPCDPDIDKMTVTVVATGAADDSLIAAQREFRIDRSSEPPLLRAASVHTRQIRSGRMTRELEKLLTEENVAGVYVKAGANARLHSH
jgi:hypothetical protein